MKKFLKTLAVVTLVLVAVLAFGVGCAGPAFVAGKRLAPAIPEDVVHAEGRMKTADGLELLVQSWRPKGETKGTLIVVHGLNGSVSVKGVAYNGAMPVFGKVTGSGYNWSDDKIAAVLTYVRQEWGNKSGPITAELVAAIHAKEGDRKQWSSEELLKIQ